MKLARWSLIWIAVATALVACGGGGSEPVPPPPFTADMVQGKTFYREALTQEKMLITFSSTGNGVTLWQDQGGTAVAEIPATWSIDTKGKLLLTATLGTITVALVAEAPTYLDVTADDGTGAEPARLYKTATFGTALLDRFAIADRDLAGATQTMGVGAFASSASPPPLGGGTMASTNGFDDSSGTWSGNADGSVTFADKPGEETVVYLRADSVVSSPKVLHIVGRVQDAGTSTFRKIADAILTETPAKSGFTAGMVEGKTFFRDNRPTSRSIISYGTGAGREEWYEDPGGVQHRLGTWTLTSSGSLRVFPSGGLPELAAVLVDDAATHWDLLVNTGTLDNPIINPAVLEKTVAVTADQWYTWNWSVVHVDLTLGTVGPYTISIGNGTGTDSGGQAFTWVVQGDGSILVTWPNTDTLLIYQRPISVPPKTLETAGVWTTGSGTSLRIQTYTRP